jgi:hypothetical protein
VYALPETGTLDDSSAYESAEKVQVTAASTKEITSAGPATAAPLPMTTKIPVPMIAPTPKAVSPNAPMDLLSSSPLLWVSSISAETSLVTNSSLNCIPGVPTTFGSYRSLWRSSSRLYRIHHPIP